MVETYSTKEVENQWKNHPRKVAVAFGPITVEVKFYFWFERESMRSGYANVHFNAYFYGERHLFWPKPRQANGKRNNCTVINQIYFGGGGAIF